MDLEDSALLNLCNKGPEAVLDYIYAKHSIKDHFYLMIDEIQYLEEPSSFLKIIHDHYKEKVKCLVSGSSSFDIKSKFKSYYNIELKLSVNPELKLPADRETYSPDSSVDLLPVLDWLERHEHIQYFVLSNAHKHPDFLERLMERRKARDEVYINETVERHRKIRLAKERKIWPRSGR